MGKRIVEARQLPSEFGEDLPRRRIASAAASTGQLGDRRPRPVAEHGSTQSDAQLTARRDHLVRETMTRFAGRLEGFLKENPYQWLNFYDFWGDAALEK